MRNLLIIISILAFFPAMAASAGPREDVIAQLETLAKSDDANFSGFDAARGKKLFSAKFSTGKPETPSCTSCHSTSPKNAGETRAGKAIDPMALSKTSDRYTDPKKVEKWFRRNCNSVLGRECTPLEKGDFLAFMISQ
ncbi:MAG: DUF1924 domain-containing protein [Devosiaceae bacterium]|nr:DUF1924 domain-containing protein [Devosiaceae bacterium]